MASVSTTSTGTILDRIVADTRELVATRSAAVPLAALREQAMQSSLPAPFASVLRGADLRLIAEVKKASPSKGLFDPEMQPVERAAAYVKGGAAAISVLTEPFHFLGDLAFLRQIKDGLRAGRLGCPPLLRKDFLFDPYQVYEARAAGADAILLIVAILPDALLTDLLSLAESIRLGVLVEVHDEDEVERALRSGAQVLGINNRDLRTFHTSLDVTKRLRPRIPADRIVVSESGISTAAHAEDLAAQNVDAVLVGESLMLAGDVAAKMQELMVSRI